MRGRSCDTKPLATKRGANLRKHGMSGTPEHRAWCWMMTRCYWSKPGDRNFELYQGAGVIVCDRWHEFTNFLADMGAKPSSRHSLDRFPNPAGNYEPGNCRWARLADGFCPQGHDLGAHGYRRPDGRGWTCRACNNEAAKRSYAKRRAAPAPSPPRPQGDV